MVQCVSVWYNVVCVDINDNESGPFIITQSLAVSSSVEQECPGLRGDILGQCDNMNVYRAPSVRQSNLRH